MTSTAYILCSAAVLACVCLLLAIRDWRQAGEDCDDNPDD